jgi:hypothetical protein
LEPKSIEVKRLYVLNYIVRHLELHIDESQSTTRCLDERSRSFSGDHPTRRLRGCRGGILLESHERFARGQRVAQ